MKPTLPGLLCLHQSARPTGVRTGCQNYGSSSSPRVAAAQQDIAWAQHLVMIDPLWIGMMPAMMKGFLKQVFRPASPSAQTPERPRYRNDGHACPHHRWYSERTVSRA